MTPEQEMAHPKAIIVTARLRGESFLMNFEKRGLYVVVRSDGALREFSYSPKPSIWDTKIFAAQQARSWARKTSTTIVYTSFEGALNAG